MTNQDTTIALPSLHMKRGDDKWIDLFKSGRYQEAIDFFQRSMVREPGNWNLHFNVGCVYFRMNEYSKALDAFKMVAKLKPEYGKAYYLQGVCYRLMGDNPQAKAAFQKVLDLDPKNKEVLTQIQILKNLELRDQEAK